MSRMLPVALLLLFMDVSLGFSPAAPGLKGLHGLSSRSLRSMGPRMSAQHPKLRKLALDQLKLSASATSEAVAKSADVAEEAAPASTAIVGSGPTGLATAIMLARRGWKGITIYDRLPRGPGTDPEFWENNDRAYNIGIDMRGQKSLRALGCLERIEQNSADCIGRMDWTPETPEPKQVDLSKERGYVTKVIQRDRLAACLLEEIEAKYSDQITIKFNTQVTYVSWGDKVKIKLMETEKDELRPATVTLKGDAAPLEVDFLIGADGVRSAVRDAMVDVKGFKVKTYEDQNVRVYKTIAMKPPEGMPKNLNYSCRTEFDIQLDALPTREGGLIGVVIFRPDDERVKELQTVEDAKEFFANYLPMFVDYVRDDEAYSYFVQATPSKFPVFQYTAPVLHKDDSTVLLGDSIHTVKPFFGLGVNSAFEDIWELNNCLDRNKGSRADALSDFSKRRAKEAKAIVKTSRAFDRPGFFGFVSFILPIILDAIFVKMAPRLFKPNFLSYSKDASITFTQALARKKVDRVMQIAFVGTFLYLVGTVLSMLIGATRRLLFGV